MTTKKNHKKSTPVAETSPTPTPTPTLNPTLNPIGGANPLPSGRAPDVPFDGSPDVIGRGLRIVQAAQVAQAPTAVTELRSSDAYKEHLGEKVIPASTLADSIEFAWRWSDLDANADSWKAYTHQQTMRAWDYALGQVRKVHKNLAAAVENDPSLAAKMPKFVELVMAQNSSATRAASTRRAVKAAKEAVAEKAAPTPPAVAPTASGVPTKQ